MKTILEEIMEHKKDELEAIKSNKNLFKDTFSQKTTNIIGELKLASPSYDSSDKVNPYKLLDIYGKSKKIKGISILIDKKYFKGDINYGTYFKAKYSKPMLFKEFVISKRQIDGANYHGYDALLLLKRVLNSEQIVELANYSESKNILPIIEVDCEEDMKELLEIEGIIDYAIAINCRNLGNMEIDRQNHFRIVEKFKEELQDKIVFAFSGIDDLTVVKEYEGLFNGVLIGTYFVNNFDKLVDII